jgi:RbsD / FucU transport protein family
MRRKVFTSYHHSFTGPDQCSRVIVSLKFHLWEIQMRRSSFALAVVLLASLFLAIPADAQANWKSRVTESMPLLGHRNWILIVDSAYPLQSSPGVETIETNASHLDVLQYVLGAVNNSIHVRPLIYMDKELPFVPDDDAPGASAYRAQIAQVLGSYTIESIPHERVISQVDETSKEFHVLVLKTTMTIPYSSVFVRLDCKYWSADAEKRMRARMH